MAGSPQNNSLMMQALVYTNPNQMTCQQMVTPESVDGEVLVHVKAAGICGSDMHAFHGHDARRVPPLILGHEAAGIVVAGARAGQQVALNPLISCGDCCYCGAGRSNLCQHRTMLGMSRAGAMAEYVTIPADFALPVPADMHPVHAALMEPTACALHAITLVERVTIAPLPACRILIIGAGTIGLLVVLLLQARGCSDIHLADTNRLRRTSAEKSVAATLHDPARRAFSAEFDIIFDAVGSAGTRQTAVRAVRTGGVIMHIGLQEASGDFDARKITLEEISFLGTYTYTVPELRQSVDALYSGQLGDLSWVETRPLADGATAFADLDAGNTAAAKIVLIP